MRFLVAILLTVFLVGCNGYAPVKPEAPVIKETKFVVKTPDAKLLKFPAPVADIDVDTASQAEASEWLINKEAYTTSLENQLIEVAKFLKEEQAKLDAEAAK
jgi:PBP1b-binding outer membrane lipoprotein LpoB